MNNFANSLLNLLLSWMRSLFGSLLSLIQGNDAGLLQWLSKHWIALGCILVVGGLTLDIIIYILRWHPQYVWQAQLNRLLHRHETDEMEDEEFSQGFDSALADFNFADTPIPDLTISEQQPLDPLETYYEEALPSPEPEIDYSQLPGASQVQEERRRRSQRHGRRAMHSVPRFRISDLNDSARHAAYPEPPVNARDAFHEAVYPSAEITSYQEQNDEDFHHV